MNLKQLKTGSDDPSIKTGTFAERAHSDCTKIIIIRECKDLIVHCWGSFVILCCINFEKDCSSCNNLSQLYSVTIICVHQIYFKAISTSRPGA